MKLTKFVEERIESPQETKVSSHLFERVFAKDGRILEFFDGDKEDIIAEYEDIKLFIDAHPEHPDIKYAQCNARGQVSVNYGSPRSDKYCRHPEKIKVFEEEIGGEPRLIKTSCSFCGLEWRERN